MAHKIPLSVIIVTKNEARNIERCLDALVDFDELIVVDSNSGDETKNLARGRGASVIDFQWDGLYPKKRQWCLDNLKLKYDWVFFVDGDEVVTDALVDEIRGLFVTPPPLSGYFVSGQYYWQGKLLRHGLVNNKLVLFDRACIEFPVVNDLDIDGMGEIEGHYQPVLKKACQGQDIGQIDAALIHYAHEDPSGWQRRHERYARWEMEMNMRDIWPRDPSKTRQMLKHIFRNTPFRPVIAFMHCYILKLGILDGRAGFDFARSRYKYYKMISA